MGIIGHFTTFCAAKLIMFFNLLCQNVVDVQNRLLCGKKTLRLLGVFSDSYVLRNMRLLSLMFGSLWTLHVFLFFIGREFPDWLVDRF